MRARDCIYHLDCFLCFSCNKPLNTGDTYGIHCDQVFCQEDYEHLLNNFNTDTSYCNDYSTGFPGNIGDMLTFCGEPMSKGRSRKRKHLLAPDGCLQLGMYNIFIPFIIFLHGLYIIHVFFFFFKNEVTLSYTNNITVFLHVRGENNNNNNRQKKETQPNQTNDLSKNKKQQRLFSGYFL